MRWSRLVAPILVLAAVNLTACGGIRPPGQGLESNRTLAPSSQSAPPVSPPYFGSITWAQRSNHAGDYPGGLRFEERGLRPGAQVTINLSGTGTITFVCSIESPLRQTNPARVSRRFQESGSFVVSALGVVRGFLPLVAPQPVGWTCPPGYLGGPYHSEYIDFQITDATNQVVKQVDRLTSGS